MKETPSIDVITIMDNEDLPDGMIINSDTFKCTICTFTFPGIVDLNSHIEIVHSNTKPSAIDENPNLCSVVNTEAMVEEVTCRECQFEAESSDNLQNHMEKHDWMCCEKCTFKTKHAADIKTHVKEHEKGQSGIVIKCPFCQLESKNEEFLKVHIHNIHIKEGNVTDNENEIINHSNETFSKCEHCTFVGSNVDMENHVIKVHGVAVICGVCGNIFPDEKTGEEHINAKHKKTEVPEPFPCDECQLVLANFYHLQKHKTDYHTNKKDVSVTCDECNVILKDFPSLTAHKKEEHAAKQFYCHECDYGSNLYTELWKHRFMTHDVSKGQDMDPAEMFMNVIAAQQDFIVNQLEKTEKRWEAEFKGIHVNQNKLFDEIKALNKTVSKNQNVPKELIKETMENITTKAEDVLRSFQREMRKENVGPASTKEEVAICRGLPEP